jgi:hypothetical protein
MAINKSYKRWLIAIILILAAVFIIDWFVNRNRIKTNSRYENTIENGKNK